MVYSNDRVTLRFLAMPGDVGVEGRAVSAGRVLEWIDRAAYACAVGWSGAYCVTAYVGDVHFTNAIQPGQLVEVHARIVLTGKSSMHVLVSVECSDIQKRASTKAMHCLFVMVAVGNGGFPFAVSEWLPQTHADRILQARVSARIDHRKLIQESMGAAVYSDLGTTPRIVFRFLAAPSDVNYGGNAHGGTVMRWIDEAAFACAASWSSREAVAVYAGGIQFRKPIKIGAIVEVDARLIHTGPHSMHVSVRVRSGAITSSLNLQHAAQCLSVFVVPVAGRATAIHSLTLVTEEDKRLDAHARQLIELRTELAVIPASLVRPAPLRNSHGKGQTLA